MQNPYAVNQPGKFAITFEKEVNGVYCFRLNLAGHKGLDAQMFESEVSTWLMDNTHGEHEMGRVLPMFGIDDPKDPDCFVLFDRFIDVVLFERQFGVSGYSPTLAPPVAV